MKKDKVIYWTSTTIIFLFDAVILALTSHTQLAVEGIRHLGYPDYFRVELTVFKVIGGLVLILPKVPARFKEWAYVGFAINFTSAAISHSVVDGLGFQSFFPIIILSILMASYFSYHKLNRFQSLSLA